MDSELVTGPDGELVDIKIPAEQPPDVDPRIIGTYNGNGAMMKVDKIDNMYPGLFGVIMSGVVATAIAFIIIWMIQLLLNDNNYTADQLRGIAVFSAMFGLAIAMLMLSGSWHFIAAKLRYGATSQEAAYWQQNRELRENCRIPHTKAEFLKLLDLAQELDRIKAPEYVAERTSKFFAQMADDRGLWRKKASSAWLGPTVLQGIMDAQHPGNDPDDEQSGASEE